MPATKNKAAPKEAAAKSAKPALQADDHKSHTTVDHNEIRRWVEGHGGWPAAVRFTEKGDDPGLLRIEFSRGSSDSLEEIEWDEFFEKFDEKGLAFLYQPSSRFNKLVMRETAGPSKSRGKTKTASK